MSPVARRTLLGESGHALLEILRARTQFEGEGFVRQSVVRRDIERPVHHHLGQPKCDRGRRAERIDQCPAREFEPRIRHDLVNEVPTRRRTGIDLPTEKKDFARPGEPHQTAQQESPATVRRKSPGNEGLDEACGFTRHDEVARKSDMSPDSTRNAPHDRDDRQLDIQEGGNQSMGLAWQATLNIPRSWLDVAPRVHVTQVHARAEMLTRPIQDNHAKLGIIDSVFNMMNQSNHHRACQRVSARSPIESQPQNALTRGDGELGSFFIGREIHDMRV